MLAWLFQTAGFVPKASGQAWTPRLIQFARLAEITIAISLVTIAVMLLIAWKYRVRQRNSGWIVLFFVLFLSALASCHFISWLAFVYPYYHLYTVLDCTAAILSFGTVPMLLLVVLRLLNLTPPAEVEAIKVRTTRLEAHTNRLQRLIQLKDRRMAKLRETVKRLTLINEELKGPTSLTDVIRELETLSKEDEP